VFLVRRREVDLLRIASAACCLGAGRSPLVSAGLSGRRAVVGQSYRGNGDSGGINRTPSTRWQGANRTQAATDLNTAIGELTGGTLERHHHSRRGSPASVRSGTAGLHAQ